MRIGRAILIPAILSISVAGSLITGSAMTAAAAPAPSVHVLAAAASAHPDMGFRG